MSESIEDWIKKIGERDLPIFKYTATEISRGVADDDTSTAQLTKIILHDTSLTSRILRIANSAMYNPGHYSVSTISRAILILGFEMVKSISMSLAILDSLLKTRSREQVGKLMAKSFHAATLAQEMATRRKDEAIEEVFVAALLSGIGEIAFWCVAEDVGEEILVLAAEKGCSIEVAQEQILGFTFNQLTVVLTKDWSMGDLFHSSINKPALGNPRIQDISLSRELANSAPAGWDDSGTQSAILKIAKHIKLDEREAEEFLRQQALDAAETIRAYGAAEIIAYLPVPDEAKIREETDESTPEIFPEPDPLLQLGILKDLGSTMETAPAPTVILEIILEGINRGIGLDRCLFALLSPDRTSLVGKFALGNNIEALSDHFKFSINTKNIFSRAIDGGRAMWVRNSRAPEYAELFTEEINTVLGTDSCLLYPIVINGKSIGVIYADRQPSKRLIDEDMFSSFTHFGQQACMAIEYISRRK